MFPNPSNRRRLLSHSRLVIAIMFLLELSFVLLTCCSALEFGLTSTSSSAQEIRTGDFQSLSPLKKSTLTSILSTSTPHQRDAKIPPERHLSPQADSANKSTNINNASPKPQQQAELEASKETTTTSSATSGESNSWIEKILFRVENLNLEDERQRLLVSKLERKLALPGEASTTISTAESTGGDSDDLQVSSYEESNAPLAPTDSADDPLEATTVTSRQISDGGESTGKTTMSSPVQEQQATYSTLANPQQLSTAAPSAPIQQQQQQQQVELIDELEERLVETNNVSAMIASLVDSGSSSAISRAPSAWKTEEIKSSDQLSTQVQTPTTASTAMSCDQAYTQCALRKACAPALRAYNDDCQDLINNKTTQCSNKCLKAMISLRSSEEGDDLIRCDCQGDEYCVRSKQRSLACKPQVEEAIKPSTVVSCSTASWICLADQSCSSALEHYYLHCQSLFSQRYCSLHCNNSLSILNRQPKASKLIDCQCDGSEEFPCVKYKTYTERFCLNKISQQQILNIDHQLVAAKPVGKEGEEDEGEDDGVEGENSNLTNDFTPPSSFIGKDIEEDYEESKVAASSQQPQSTNDGDDVSISSNDSDSNNNNDEESDKDDDGGGINEESASSGFNGIQLVENNWIPLMSGRYFANLNQQQQQKAKNHHVQGQSRKKSTPRNHNSDSRLKNRVNGDVSSNQVAMRRYGRIHMSASTSSAPSSLAGGLNHFLVSHLLFLLPAGVCLTVIVVAAACGVFGPNKK